MRNIMVVLALTMLAFLVISGCTFQSGRKPEDGKVKVQCPACGTDFDALLYKQF